MAVVQKKKNIDQKTKTIKQIDEMHAKYEYLVIADSDNIKSELMHELRSKIADNAKILFGKKKIMFKALQDKKVKLQNKYITDKENKNETTYNTVFLIFTNDTSITEYLQKMSIRGYLKAGDTCKEDVVLQAGTIQVKEQNINVDMNAKLNACNLLCYVRDGKVVLDKEQTIAKQNEKIDSKQARLLKLLGYKLAELKVNVLEVIKI